MHESAFDPFDTTYVELSCRVYKRFREVRPDLVPKRMKHNELTSIKIPLEDSTEKLSELRVR